MNQNLMDFDIGADKLRECGVFGMYDLMGTIVARTATMGFCPTSTGDRKAAV